MFILIIGFTMSELVSAYPTSGGIYWWASKLGGPKAGFFTGWLNLIGLVAVTAGVAYGCATFIDLTISTYSSSYAGDYSLTRVFITFLIVLALISVLNIFSGHLMAIMNNVSVWWHVVGASAIVLILIFVPDQHQSFSYVFTERFNNSGYSGGSTTSFGVLVRDRAVRVPADAVHDHRLRRVRPPVRGDLHGVHGGGQGHLALDPLLGDRRLHPAAGVVFAIPNAKDGSPDNAGVGAGGVAYIFTQSMGNHWAAFVLFISASAQFFCATSCMTSASRMTFAFSRDGAIPGSRPVAEAHLEAGAGQRRGAWSRSISAIVTLPALIKVNIGTAEAPLIIPVAFYAVTSIAVIGLYLAFAIPIWLRWRHGDRFEVGSWNNGSKYKWMNPIAVAEIIIVSLVPDAAVRALRRTRSTAPSTGSSSTTHRSSRSARCSSWPSGGRCRRRTGSPGPKHNIDPGGGEVARRGSRPEPGPASVRPAITST